MTQTQNQLASQQNYIAQLLEQLIVNYQNTKLERKQIAQNFSGSGWYPTEGPITQSRLDNLAQTEALA